MVRESNSIFIYSSFKIVKFHMGVSINGDKPLIYPNSWMVYFIGKAWKNMKKLNVCRILPCQRLSWQLGKAQRLSFFCETKPLGLWAFGSLGPDCKALQGIAKHVQDVNEVERTMELGTQLFLA